MWENYKYVVPDKRKVRYIVHTDCKNEADDQYTLAHALMMDKLEVRGIIAGHFCKAHYGRFPEHATANASYDEVMRVLDCMGLKGQYPVYVGANDPIPDSKTPIQNGSGRPVRQIADKLSNRAVIKNLLLVIGRKV